MFSPTLVATIGLALLLSPPAEVYSPPAADAVRDWLTTLPLDSRVAPQLATYEGVDLEPYCENRVVDLRDRVASEVTAALVDILRHGPHEFVDVQYGLGEPKPDGGDARDLEDSFVRTEAVAFFPGVDHSPGPALRTYVSEEFRRKISSRILHIQDDGDHYCIDTNGIRMFLGPMKQCARISELHWDSVASQHSQVISDADGDGLQAVYFKESVKTFVRVNGGLAVHYLNYSRTKGINRFLKPIASRKFRGRQREAFAELAVELGAGQSEATSAAPE